MIKDISPCKLITIGMVTVCCTSIAPVLAPPSRVVHYPQAPATQQVSPQMFAILRDIKYTNHYVAWHISH